VDGLMCCAGKLGARAVKISSGVCDNKITIMNGKIILNKGNS
jgi:hypothetical protein